MSKFFLCVAKFLGNKPDCKAPLFEIVGALKAEFPGMRKPSYYTAVYNLCKQKKLVLCEQRVYMLSESERQVRLEADPVRKSNEAPKADFVAVPEVSKKHLVSEVPSKKNLIVSARDFLKKAIVNILSVRGAIPHSDLYSVFLVEIESMLESGDLTISRKGEISLQNASMAHIAEQVKDVPEVVPLSDVSAVVLPEENTPVSEKSETPASDKRMRLRRPVVRSTELYRNDYLAYKIFRDSRELTREDFSLKAREKRIPEGNISGCIISLCDKGIICWDKEKMVYSIIPDVGVTVHPSALVDPELLQDELQSSEDVIPVVIEETTLVSNDVLLDNSETKVVLRVEDFLEGIFLRGQRRMRFDELLAELQKVGFSDNHDTKNALGRALQTMVDEEDRKLFQSVRNGESGWEIIVYPKDKVVMRAEESVLPAFGKQRKSDRPINPKVPVLCNYFYSGELREVTYKEMITFLTDRKMLESKSKMSSPISTLRSLGILSSEVQGSGKYQINREELIRWINKNKR